MSFMTDKVLILQFFKREGDYLPPPPYLKTFFKTVSVFIITLGFQTDYVT